MTNEVETCQLFKRLQEAANELGLTISVKSSYCFEVLDCNNVVVAKAAYLKDLDYVLYGWAKCFEKYLDRIGPC